MQDLIIIGAGGFAREVAWLIEDISETQAKSIFEVVGVVSATLPVNWSHPLPILGDDQWAYEQISRKTICVIAIGNSAMRKTLAVRYSEAGFSYLSLIHPSVRKSNTVAIGHGSILCAGTTLTTDIVIGIHVIINLHCTIGHDVTIGDYCTLSPGVHVSGGVSIGAGCEIGTGAVLLPGVSLGAGCRVGAGAVVHRDLEAGKTYVGVPARES